MPLNSLTPESHNGASQSPEEAALGDGGEQLNPFFPSPGRWRRPRPLRPSAATQLPRSLRTPELPRPGVVSGEKTPAAGERGGENPRELK